MKIDFGPVQAHFDRVCGNTQDLCDCVGGKTFVFVEDESRPLFFGQGVHGGVEEGTQFLFFQPFIRFAAAGVLHLLRSQAFYPTLSFLSADDVQRTVHGYAVDPGGDFAPVTEFPCGSVNLEKNVLGGFLGLLIVAGQAEAGTVNQAFVAFDKLPESVPVL